MRVSRLLLALALFAATGTEAGAQDYLTLGAYRKHGADAPELVSNYLSGLRDGIVLYDAYAAKYLGSEKHICKSEGADLTTKGFKKLLDDRIAQGGSGGKPWPDDIPLQAVAIFALIKAFPCN